MRSEPKPRAPACVRARRRAPHARARAAHAGRHARAHIRRTPAGPPPRTSFTVLLTSPVRPIGGSASRSLVGRWPAEEATGWQIDSWRDMAAHRHGSHERRWGLLQPCHEVEVSLCDSESIIARREFTFFGPAGGPVRLIDAPGGAPATSSTNSRRHEHPFREIIDRGAVVFVCRCFVGVASMKGCAKNSHR